MNAVDRLRDPGGMIRRADHGGDIHRPDGAPVCTGSRLQLAWKSRTNDFWKDGFSSERKSSATPISGSSANGSFRHSRRAARLICSAREACWRHAVAPWNGKLDDQAPAVDILLLMEHGSPKAARIFSKGRHMGREPGMDETLIPNMIIGWLKERLGR